MPKVILLITIFTVIFAFAFSQDLTKSSSPQPNATLPTGPALNNASSGNLTAPPTNSSTLSSTLTSVANSSSSPSITALSSTNPAPVITSSALPGTNSTLETSSPRPSSTANSYNVTATVNSSGQAASVSSKTSNQSRSWANYNKGSDKSIPLPSNFDAKTTRVVPLLPEPNYFSTVPQSSFDQVFNGNGSNSQSSDSDVVKSVVNFIDSSLMDVVWCGEQKDVIFILSEKNTLYRSVDEAVSGQVLTSHLNQLGKAELEGESGQVGEVSRILQSPVDKSMLLFVGTHGINWITEDCGSSFKAMNQGRKVDEFQFHPVERNWLLASAWTLCDDFIDEPCLNYKELFVTKNLGHDWNLIAKYVVDFSWAYMDFSFFRIPKDRVIISHDVDVKGHQKVGKWKKHRQVSYSDDLFNKTTIPLVQGGNKFLLTTNYLMVVKIADEDKQHVTLLVGSPREKNYRMRPIEIPNKKISDHGYTVVDTSEHSVFLHVDHKGSNTPFGHLYVSDSTGVRYSLALKYNAKDTEGQCDFERVQGIDGVYLANIFDESIAKKYKTADTESSEFPVQSPGIKKTAEDAYQHSQSGFVDQNSKRMGKGLVNSQHFEDYRKTKISFNKGNTWNLLTPPKTSADGKKVVCNPIEGCSLHLHSVSNSRFGPFYTTETSLGLILGTGNIGSYLSNRPDEVNTYLTRDAGLTWFEIAKGSHIYEVGDHGGLIVMASNQNATRSILYSWNEGMTWNRLTISDTYIQITNIITEPSNIGEKFIIYGREAFGVKGVIVALDFSSLHQRVCENPQNPDTPESDYETWSPNGKISAECLLGRKIDYIRRKRESQCFNQEQFDQWRFIQLCECTEDDWECDYGYERKGNGPCLPIDEKTKNAAMTPPEECEAYYFMTQGYRKVAGNQCRGGLSHDPIKLPCPGTRLFDAKSTSTWLILAVVVVVCIWINRSANFEHFKKQLNSFKVWVESKFKDPRKQGYNNQIPDSLRDDDEAFSSNQLYDEETEQTVEVEEPNNEPINLIDEPGNRRMNQSRAFNAANKHVPLLNRPDDRGRLDQIRGNQ